MRLIRAGARAPPAPLLPAPLSPPVQAPWDRRGEIMATTIRRILIVAAAGALWVQGQEPARLSGPVIGFVFDGSARALRPILGIPGASLVGNPLDVGFALESGFVAPR